MEVGGGLRFMAGGSTRRAAAAAGAAGGSSRVRDYAAGETRTRTSRRRARTSVRPRAFLGILKNLRGKKKKENMKITSKKTTIPNKSEGKEPGEAFSDEYGIVPGGKPKGRRAGVVLHPTSLPGSYGVGDLGPSAYRFVDWLEKAGMQAWQVLPLVPPERMYWSPYAGQNANSGNVLLISLEELLEDKLLQQSELPLYVAPANADFQAVADAKEPLLTLAANRLLSQKSEESPLKGAFEEFCEANADWLEAAALFHCLSNSEDLLGLSWWEWPVDLRDMEEDAIRKSTDLYEKEIMEFKALQFLFHKQWIAVRKYANSKGVSIIGDMPIYVGGHSADVWANRSLFELNEEGKALFVSGVPPDAFSKNGQLWGNPLYDWKAQEKDGFKWWIRRLKRAFDLYDETRIDHFRGFAGYWSVNSKEETAMVGTWRAGPGVALFDALKESLGEANIMAEDLGVITPDVVELREEIGAPGMLVLQFGFDGNPTNPHLPHNHYENCFIYPGTHDNDTTNGWYEKQGKTTREFVEKYLGYADHDDMAWTMINAAMSSVARSALFTMQDILSLDNSGRMNLPGTAEGNWAWRMSGEFCDWSNLDEIAFKLRNTANRYDRINQPAGSQKIGKSLKVVGKNSLKISF